MFALLLFGTLSAQTVTGTVYDENNLALPGASVYLDGTSTGTVTADDGTFRLTIASQINTALVFSFIGYESQLVAGPFKNKRYEVHLKPRTDMLREVVIQKGGFTRKQMLAIFLKEFLGRSKAGKSCRILNLDDISLRYDYKSNRITAASNAPLKITNPYLGYEIDFNLVECSITFSSRSVKAADVVSNAFTGTTVFREMSDPEKVFPERRRKTYQGSGMEFFRNLTSGNWGNEYFQLYKCSYPTDPTSHFEIAYDEGTFKVKVLAEHLEIKGMTLEPRKFYASYNLLYRKRDQSKVIFKTETFYVDGFGNTDSPMKIEFSGEISRQRAGDLLPMDYTP